MCSIIIIFFSEYIANILLLHYKNLTDLLLLCFEQKFPDIWTKLIFQTSNKQSSQKQADNFDDFNINTLADVVVAAVVLAAEVPTDLLLCCKWIK